MDGVLFSELLGQFTFAQEETTSYKEILNYSDRRYNKDELHVLGKEDFPNYVKQKGVFAPEAPKGGAEFKNGIRLVVQSQASHEETFASDYLPMRKHHYELLVREMQLPFLWLETSAAVGPFFWWTHKNNSKLMQLVFRKSDVKSQAEGTRGWEMVLSYSFDTRITSGFVKGTRSAELDAILKDMSACTSSATHPLLLPVLMLNKEISISNDKRQRKWRHELRKVECIMSNRYAKKDTLKPEESPEPINLDKLDSQLTDLHCNILWKNPTAWKGAVAKLQAAAAFFWDQLPPEQKDEDLTTLHEDLLRRLGFISDKLDPLDSYTQVTLERLGLQRDVMSSIISHRESRISLLIAVRQQQLANSSTRDSMSMHTLTFLGIFFLPSTFLCSLFSMPFFDFGKNMHGRVSSLLWIYFVLAVPLTLVIVGVWYMFHRRSQMKIKGDSKETEIEMLELEKRVAEDIRIKKDIRLYTFPAYPV